MCCSLEHAANAGRRESVASIAPFGTKLHLLDDVGKLLLLFSICLCVCVGLGGLSVSIEGASKADIQCSDIDSDGQCCVTYHPTAPGLYVVNILFAEQPVQGLYLFSSVYI